MSLGPLQNLVLDIHLEHEDLDRVRWYLESNKPTKKIEKKMDIMITNFTKEERKKKNIHTNEKGNTIMYDENGRKWTLAGEFDTIEEVERARDLLKRKEK